MGTRASITDQLVFVLRVPATVCSSVGPLDRHGGRSLKSMRIYSRFLSVDCVDYHVPVNMAGPKVSTILARAPSRRNAASSRNFWMELSVARLRCWRRRPRVPAGWLCFQHESSVSVVQVCNHWSVDSVHAQVAGESVAIRTDACTFERPVFC